MLLKEFLISANPLSIFEIYNTKGELIESGYSQEIKLIRDEKNKYINVESWNVNFNQKRIKVYIKK